MNKFKHILSGFLVTIYLLALMYAILNNDEISAYFNLSLTIIPSISLISVLLIGINYTRLFFKIDRLEFEFTSIVNHAFRTPLTRIMWLVKELEKELPHEQRLLFLQNVENTTSRVIGIVDLIAGMKEASNPFGYVFQAVSIREMIEKSIEKHREAVKQKNISFQVSTFKDIPLLTLDIKKISFVFDVLVENAVFYTPKDGHINIDCIAKKNKIVFFVSDSGLGLTFMEKFRVFSKFYRSEKARLMNTDGMGLGLYLAKIIVERHKGSIYVESKGRDKGATFYVELPYGK
ncbi:HAMP domain-containing histidine kinase [Candidatus Nomurabacteria bacterium]|nr:HAMP domain-containing histidine kinase [Candidatus Nomurabacteria bacterium]